MGYLLLSFFLVIFLIINFQQSHLEKKQDNAEITVISRQRATETIHYIDAVNDFIYKNRDSINSQEEIVLSDSQIGIKINNNIHNVIFNYRAYVWQVPDVGLMDALKTQTISSALLGTVKNRRIKDNGNVDMNVPVPSMIPEGAIVYIN